MTNPVDKSDPTSITSVFNFQQFQRELVRDIDEPDPKDSGKGGKGREVSPLFIAQKLLQYPDVRALFEKALGDRAGNDLERLDRGLAEEVKQADAYIARVRERRAARPDHTRFEEHDTNGPQSELVRRQEDMHALIGDIQLRSVMNGGHETKPSITAVDVLHEIMSWQRDPSGHAGIYTFQILDITPEKLFPDLKEERRQDKRQEDTVAREADVAARRFLGVLDAIEERIPGLAAAVGTAAQRFAHGHSPQELTRPVSDNRPIGASGAERFPTTQEPGTAPQPKGPEQYRNPPRRRSGGHEGQDRSGGRSR